MKKITAFALTLGLLFAATPAYAHGPSNWFHPVGDSEVGHWTYDNEGILQSGACAPWERVWIRSTLSGFTGYNPQADVVFFWRGANDKMHSHLFSNTIIFEWPSTKTFIVYTAAHKIKYARTQASNIVNGSGASTLDWGCYVVE